MRKLFLSTLAFFCIAFGLLQAQNPQVKTSDGILEGLDRSGVKVFKGVPFAAPPVGDLRWKAPQPVQKWEGVRLAHEYGPNPMQEAVFGDMNFGTKEMSEDCLYLNIWTPAKTMSEKLPVLIYFNGGGLMAGSGSEPRYAGWSMARKGIISITANYREGIFGFFAHPELSRETAYKGSGNYGFLDQVAAIAWVKKNIAAFGGDPSRITIVGESAGSISVSLLMASPLCQGLFAQAMGSSGAVHGFGNIPTLKEAEAQGEAKMKELNCRSVADLRAIPAEELMKKAAVKSMPSCNLDNYFMPEQPLKIYSEGKQAQVPLLVGGNSCEMVPMAILAGKPATIENLKAGARATFGDAVDKVFELYGLNTDADVLSQKGVDLASDLFLAYGTWKWGNMHKLTGNSPVYRYFYSHPRPDMIDKSKVAGLAGGVQDKKAGEESRPAPKISGAVHSADIEYAMGTLSTNLVFDWQPEDFWVSEIFQNYYANFVKTGNPNGLGLPEWTPTTGQAVPPVLHLDVETFQTADKQLEERYQFIDSILSPKE